VTFTGAYTSGGTSARVYTISSPYAAADLAGLKFAQDVNTMVICSPNHGPYQLVYTSAASWAITAVTIGSTVSAPTGQAVATTAGAGNGNYAYVITAVDANGQESAPSGFATVANIVFLYLAPATNTVTWSTVTGAVSYNVYRAVERVGAAVPAGSMFGFVGNCTSTTFVDTLIDADFSQSVPIVKNPFTGSGVQSVTITNAGSYTNGVTFPSVSFTGGGGTGATGIAYGLLISATVSNGGHGYVVGDVLQAGLNFIRVDAVATTIGGVITAVSIVSAGPVQSGQFIPANPFPMTGGNGFGATLNLTWGVTSVGILSPGTGYGPAPTVVFSSGAAAGTAILGAPPAGNPTVPQFHQQRLAFAGPVSNPRQFNMSQPGTYYNFNVTDPIQPDNAFQGFLVSGKLNTIQSMISQPQGLMVLSDQSAWLVTGGSPGSAISAVNATANPQVFSGANGVPPIIAGADVLYVQSKGSIVRNVVFNFDKQVYTGTDITVLSSHNFYGYQIHEWAWAEEPFKIVWAVRSDGALLPLTFLKEQELVAWAGPRTTQGAFQSICTIPETVAVGTVDAIYVVVQRTINGQVLQYIERFAEQYYPNGVTDAWQVDAGLQYNGVATTSFTGAAHLSNEAVVGLATDDLGNVTAFTATVSATGTFSLTAPASPATGYTRVTVGLSYTPQLQTLDIDTGDPTIQGKMKKIPAATLRVKDTLGLKIGTSFDSSVLVPMEDLIIGNIGKDTNEEVTTAMVTGDALQTIDSAWQENGRFCVQQDEPWPATILGVIPQLTVGDTKDSRS
jgi:hypothetical protein